MNRSMICIFTFVFVVLASYSSQLCSSPWTPVAWKDGGKFRNWARDANHNFVDDLIEDRGGQMKVIVDLNNCLGDPATNDFVAYLRSFGDIILIGKYLSFVMVTGVDRNEAQLIGAQPEVAMVELALNGKFEWDIYEAARVKSSTAVFL